MKRSGALSSRLMALLVIAIGLALNNLLVWKYVGGDPLAYYERIGPIAAGAVPYVDADFEHLPVMLVPMLVAWFVGGASDPFVFRTIWVLMGTVALVVIAGVLDRIGHELSDEGIGRRWVIICGPLLPLVAFRTEPWVILPVVLAVLGLLRSENRLTGMGIGLGILAKGWPVVLIPGAWRSRMWAWPTWSGVGAVVVLGAVIAQPGFATSRSFEGVHTETIGGALAAVLDRTRGVDSIYVESAGALYIDAGSWAWYLGIAIGVSVGSWALVGLLRSREPRQMLELTGALVVAVLMASPLQSTQFLAWAGPFAAISRSRMVHIAYALAGVAGLWSVIRLDDVFAQGWVWPLVVLARNLMLLVVGVGLVRGGQIVESVATR